MTASSLDSRCHFNHSHSGFSTFRRSLGAIPKQTLDLKALPRSSGQSSSNTQNFRFDEAGEVRLTEWMREKLRYTHIPVNEGVETVEAEFIRSLEGIVKLARSAACGTVMGMSTTSNPYRGFSFPAEIINQAIWLYHCFSLSLHDVELILAARGVVVSYETIREWSLRFGRAYAKTLKRRPQPGDKWFLDGVSRTHL